VSLFLFIARQEEQRRASAVVEKVKSDIDLEKIKAGVGVSPSFSVFSFSLHFQYYSQLFLYLFGKLQKNIRHVPNIKITPLSHSLFSLTLCHLAHVYFRNI
jgi:hypothetical protein